MEGEECRSSQRKSKALARISGCVLAGAGCGGYSALMIQFPYADGVIPASGLLTNANFR